MAAFMASLKGIVKFIIMVGSWLIERDQEKRNKKKDILKEAKDATINKRDPSAVIAIFDRINRL